MLTTRAKQTDVHDSEFVYQPVVSATSLCSPAAVQMAPCALDPRCSRCRPARRRHPGPRRTTRRTRAPTRSSTTQTTRCGATRFACRLLAMFAARSKSSPPNCTLSSAAPCLAHAPAVAPAGVGRDARGGTLQAVQVRTPLAADLRACALSLAPRDRLTEPAQHASESAYLIPPRRCAGRSSCSLASRTRTSSWSLPRSRL